MYAQILNNNGLWLSIAIITVLILSLLTFKKEIQIDYIYFFVLYDILIILSVFIGTFLGNILIHMMNISSLNIYFVLVCTIAKISQFIITLFLIIRTSTLSDFKKWNVITITDALSIITMMLITYFFIENLSTSTLIQLLFISLFTLVISYKQMMNRMEIINNEKMNLIRSKEIEKSNHQKLEMMKHLNNEILASEHRMFYILYQMEKYIYQEEYDKLLESLKNYRNLISKYKIVINTNNPIFGCFYSLKMNDYIVRGIDVENSIFISQKDYYNDINFLNDLTDLIDLFNQCKTLHISINEIGELLVIKIIYRDGQIIEENVSNYCKIHFSKNATYNINNHSIEGIRISINMEDNYEN